MKLTDGEHLAPSSRHKLLWIPIISLTLFTFAIIIGILIANVFMENSNLVINTSNDTQPQEQEIEFSTVLSQLMNRVEDGIRYIEITTTIIGVIVVLLGMSLGLSIWQTRKYARNLLEEGFMNLNRDKIIPIVEKQQEQLTNLTNKGLLIQLIAYRTLLNHMHQEIQEVYRRHLEIKGEKAAKISDLLSESDREHYDRNMTVQYIIASLSRDEEIVLDNLQKLSHTIRHRTSRPLLKTVIDHLHELLGTWPPGTVRAEIQRTLSEIESLDLA